MPGEPGSSQEYVLEVLALCHSLLHRHHSILSFSAWGQPHWFQQGRVFSCARPPTSRFLGPRALQVRQCSLCKTTIPTFGRRQETQATHECGIYHGEIKLDNVSVFAGPESPLPLRCEKAEFGLSLHGLDTWRMADIQTEAIAWAAPERARNTSLSPLDLLRCNVFMVSRDDSMKRNDRDGIYHQDSHWDNYSITCSVASHTAGMKVREPVVKRYCMNVLPQNFRSRQSEVGIFKPGLSSHHLGRRVEETQLQAVTLPHSVSG